MASASTSTSTFPPEAIRHVVAEIAEILKRRNETISTSEAACGGLISSYLVSVPGASQYYTGGTLTYSLKSRLKLSGWSPEDIKSYTGSSKEVAKKLARNMKMELGSTYALSETGWAGPPTGSESDGKIGTSFIGIAGPRFEQTYEKHTGLKERGANMEEMARLALEVFLEFLKQVDVANGSD